MNNMSVNPPQPVLSLENLNVWFELTRTTHRSIDFHAVRDVNLALAPGERLGLVGESGSGKTTTILAAMGLLPSSARVSGSVCLGGDDILAGGDRSVAPHRWRDIAMVFQGAMNAFNPVKTVGWQIAEALEVHRIASGKAATARVGELLELVGISADHANRFPHQFSGGMRQRAIIAMALACNPKVLLADEPTTALDVTVQKQVLNLLVRLSEQLNLALILVTHDLGVVAEICHRAAVMLKGEIVEIGCMTDLYHRPQHPYTRQLFQATPHLLAEPASSKTVSTVMGAADATRPAAPAKPEAPLLEVRNLAVTYPGRTGLIDRLRGRPAQDKQAVAGISLDLQRGEMLALVGQSGCGKTTTLQTILGMVQASAGTIRINGTDVTRLAPSQWRPLRRQIQMTYQDPYESLDLRYRIKDIVAEPLCIHGIGANQSERMSLVRAALEQVELKPVEHFMNRYPHELSGGQRQRVAIAASIILKPDLLLADEPVSMLDVSVRAGILELLSDLRRQHHMGILMITHDLSTAANYADRIAVMHEGRIVEQGAAWQVIRQPQQAYTRRLLASIPNPDPDAAPTGPDIGADLEPA